MRRNQYEEALFRCEDERFEVDMLIDTVASTIRALRPLVEEVNTLRHMSAATGDAWHCKLDGRSLSVLHLRVIARVYGDHGHEILEVRHASEGADAGVCGRARGALSGARP